jgi:hypothetical protein
VTARPLFDHVVAELSLRLGAPALSEVAGGVAATWRAVTPSGGIEYPARVRWMPARPDRIEALLTAFEAYDTHAARPVAQVDPPVVVASTNPALAVHAPDTMLARVILAPASLTDGPRPFE